MNCLVYTEMDIEGCSYWDSCGQTAKELETMSPDEIWETMRAANEAAWGDSLSDTGEVGVEDTAHPDYDSFMNYCEHLLTQH